MKGFVHLYKFANDIGSESKLTVAEQRIGVLSAIGALSHHTVSGSSTVQNLCNLAAESFMQLLKLEGEYQHHHGTSFLSNNFLHLILY